MVGEPVVGGAGVTVGEPVLGEVVGEPSLGEESGEPVEMPGVPPVVADVVVVDGVK